MTLSNPNVEICNQRQVRQIQIVFDCLSTQKRSSAKYRKALDFISKNNIKPKLGTLALFSISLNWQFTCLLFLCSLESHAHSKTLIPNKLSKNCVNSCKILSWGIIRRVSAAHEDRCTLVTSFLLICGETNIQGYSLRTIQGRLTHFIQRKVLLLRTFLISRLLSFG